MVNILLGRDEIKPDKPNSWGQIPMWCAAYCGLEELVKILLGRDDVNPGKPDEDGLTPRWWAAGNGHPGVAALLEPPKSAAYNTA